MQLNLPFMFYPLLSKRAHFSDRGNFFDPRKKKGFVISTKSFVKIEIKIFCDNNKMFGSINKTFGAAAKFLVAATKILFVVPYFVAVTKPFFPVHR